MTKNRNSGKEAEDAFEQHWREAGHIERFWDQADLRGRNGGRAVGDFPKPADYLVSSRRVPLHFAEVKSVHDKARFPFSCIRDAQHVAAIKEARHGSCAYVFYIFSYHLSQWFCMTCEQYAAAIDDELRSIPFKELSPWVK